MAIIGTVVALILGGALVSPRTIPKTINKVIEDALKDVPSAQGVFPRLSDGTFLAELDIRLSKEKFEDMMRKHLSEGGDSRSKRKATPYEDERWPNSTIPYKIDRYGFSTQTIQNIHTAMAEWEKYTCMKFRDVTDEDPNYVIIEHGEGCNSDTGMVGGNQTLNLGTGCESVDTALHELGHAIGLYHEQSRRDRDDYIWVRSEYMDPRYRFNSDMENEEDIDNYGIPYDYASIMHYGSDAFSMSNEPTIITHDPWWQFVIGTVKKLSFSDAEVVNLIYKCSAHCSEKKCPKEGYLDKNCQCICPGDTFGNPIKLCGAPDQTVEYCTDYEMECEWWAKTGECQANPDFMIGACPKSCGLCGAGCKDKLPDCQQRAYHGGCKSKPLFMFDKCKQSCGVCFGTEDDLDCWDEDRHCAYWASIGECDKNPDYMRTSCKRACASC